MNVYFSPQFCDGYYWIVIFRLGKNVGSPVLLESYLKLVEPKLHVVICAKRILKALFKCCSFRLSRSPNNNVKKIIVKTCNW